MVSFFVQAISSCFGESPEGNSKLVLNPGLCLLITRFVLDTNTILLCCVMNSLLCHGEVLHCDPFIHKFQCSKNQDKHPWFCCWLDVSLILIWMEFLDLLCFRRLITSYNFLMQLCIRGSYTLLIGFLLIIPFSLFKTVFGEDVRTVGLETSRLRSRLGVYVNFGLFCWFFQQPYLIAHSLICF